MPYRNSIVTPEWIVNNLKSIIADVSGVNIAKIQPSSPLWMPKKMTLDDVGQMLRKIELVFSVKLFNYTFMNATVQETFEYICNQYLERKLIKKTDLMLARQILHKSMPYSIPFAVRNRQKSK